MTENSDTDQKEYLVVNYDTIGQDRRIKPEYCVSIDLALEKLEKFKEDTGIKEFSDIKNTGIDIENDPTDLAASFLSTDNKFFLRSAEEIDRLPSVEREEYNEAMERYEEEKYEGMPRRPGVRFKRNSHMETVFDALGRYVEIAKKIQKRPVDGSFRSRHAVTGKMNQQITNNLVSNIATKNKGGRSKDKRTIWIEDQYRQGLTPAKILKKWDEMSEDGRKSIDPKKHQPFISPKLKDTDKIAIARENAIETIEKKRPKTDDS